MSSPAPHLFFFTLLAFFVLSAVDLKGIRFYASKEERPVSVPCRGKAGVTYQTISKEENLLLIKGMRIVTLKFLFLSELLAYLLEENI